MTKDWTKTSSQGRSLSLDPYLTPIEARRGVTLSKIQRNKGVHGNWKNGQLGIRYNDTELNGMDLKNLFVLNDISY